MGGRLILAQITSDGIKKSCKIGTWFLKNLDSLDFIKEDYFNEVVKKHNLFTETIEDKHIHQNYDDDRAMFAPYHYGILLFDFKDKKIFSCNNYNGFLMFGINNVSSDYETIGNRKQTTIEIQDIKGNILEKESIFEENKIRISTPRMIDSCIRNKGHLYVDEQKYIIREDDDYFSVAARLYGKDLSLLTYPESVEYIKEKHATEYKEEFEFSLKRWTNIEIKHDNWEIINGDRSIHYLKSAYQYYSMTNMLSEEEKEIWLEEIKNEENKEQDEEE